ncbi:ABC transporter ATP-binding protein [Pasteurellaceae bacterium LIM206]|nr:ABC transporter ATP-binding protein [Pasteurellaceae bacterium LIM206]
MSELLRFDRFSICHAQTKQILLQPLTFSLQSHRTLALVGESGSGKSLLSKAVMGLLPDTLRTEGEIYLKQRKIAPHFSPDNPYRGKQIALIVQNAMTAFDPLMPLGKQLLETLCRHTVLSSTAREERLMGFMRQVKLQRNLFARRPSQLSGGQLQRFMLALTLSLEPELIIADEPTTALDSLTQYELLPLFKQIPRQGCSLIFITHDLALARLLADEIAVLQAGKLVECQPTEQLFRSPREPYTRYLLAMREKLNQRFQQVMSCC